MNIFVAKLSFGTTEDDLRGIFEPYGDVDTVKIIMDKETGRSKGYGFVEMPNDTEALTAIHDLNDSELDGRQIVVKKSDPPKKRSFDSRGRHGGGRDRNYFRR